MKTINIGRDFSRDPAGRTIELDGDDSGEAFRERILKVELESLDEGEKLEIILDDDVVAYGSSFISEAFGALVREGYISAEQLLETLKFSYKGSYMALVAEKIRESIKDNTPK